MRINIKKIGGVTFKVTLIYKQYRHKNQCHMVTVSFHTSMRSSDEGNWKITHSLLIPISIMPILVNALFLILSTLWVLSTETINLSQKVLLYFIFPNLKKEFKRKKEFVD